MLAKLGKNGSGALARSYTLLNRLKSTLVIVEHDNQKLNPSTLNTITAASKIPKNENIICLVVGTDCGKVADEVAKIAGVGKVLLADDARFKGFMPESLSPIVVNAQKQHSYSHIAANSTAFGKNLLPRVAALLGNSQL
jgi:electron transfer flavoprotein alpha subunit